MITINISVMARVRCDKCGETFNSKYNLELHQEMNVCDGGDESESTGDALDKSSERGNRSTPEPTEVTTGATGTVCEFNEDRGFGFVTTTDVTRKISSEEAATEDVFFHISDTGTTWIEEGDRLEFTVVRGENGLRGQDVEVVKRDKDRDSYDEPEDGLPERRLGFGHDSHDHKYGPGKESPTESDIESFQDERKFR
jgi:cold shock CspA family protein